MRIFCFLYSTNPITMVIKKSLIFYFLISSLAYGQDPLVIAHRGGSGMAPENTLAAFHNAVTVNADYFELDVMISSDDSLMIIHDATVDRTTDGTGTVSEMTFEQLRALDAGSWYGPEFSGEKIPTLWESLMVARNSNNDIGVVIEIKSANASVPSKVVEIVKIIGMESRVIISSFSMSQIAEVKTLEPTIAVQLFGTITETHIDQVAAISGEWVGSGGTLTQDVIDYAHQQGIYFNAWTLNSASTMNPAIDLGVDAITTDFPVLLRSLMDETEPSDVVLTSAIPSETRVELNWEQAVDNESGISGYDIFRDEAPEATTLLASVGKVTEYTDETYTEATQFYYRIKARNLAGLTSVNYSNEIAVATLNDITAPAIQSVKSRGGSHTVVVGFSERVDQSTAETTTNYTIDNGAEVESARLALDLESVILTTTTLLEQSYMLTVKNVRDRADIPNPMSTEEKYFMHYAIPGSAVAFYELDSLPFADPNYLVVDETENQNNGIVKNGAYLTEGVLGNGIAFDGVDDFVQFSASESFNINQNSVSLLLWTKLSCKPSELSVAYAPLFDSETDNYVLYGDRGNNELRFKVATSGGAERPGIPDADIKAGEWIHVAGVYDGAQAMIYLNGVLKDAHAISGTVNAGQIATLGKTGSTYFKGSIDQVEVYSRALPEEEIMQIYEHYRIKRAGCENYFLTEDMSICSGESYTFPDGAVGTKSVVHVSELTTMDGCDSMITTYLTVIAVDASVTQNEGIITAGESGASYQWLDCDNNFEEIMGETGQSYAPLSSGNYAVEISMDGCTDTSECLHVQHLGLPLHSSSGFILYPNPNQGTFTLEFGGTGDRELILEIVSASGKRIYKDTVIRAGTLQIDISSIEKGVYILTVRSKDFLTTRKIIKL
jgi:glycerophosphoryl diester phosphodiesterase